MALRLQIENGWHTYWRNPGDSGLPTTLDWIVGRRGFAPVQSNGPRRRHCPSEPLVNYGYDDTVLHLVKLDVPADLKTGSTVDLAARADWLVCKETCIPDGADLKLALSGCRARSQRRAMGRRRSTPRVPRYRNR